MKSLKSKLFKQRLFSIHSNIGITISLLFYISLFFGMFTIFLPYIKLWEQPSRHFALVDINKINYSKILNSVISDPDYPKNNIYMEFPGFKNDPSIRVTHRFMEGKYFNPYTQEKIEIEKTTSHLAEFLNELHSGKSFRVIGKLLFGFMAVGVMFLIIGGLLLIFYLQFKNNTKTQQGNFSKWHRKILTFAFLPLLLISLSGALMNIGYPGAMPMTYLVTKGEDTNIFKVINTVLLPNEKPIKLANIEVEMMSINSLIQKAKEINPQIRLHALQLINWKDKTARVEFTGYNPYKPFLNGVYNKPKIILNAVDGSIIKDVRVVDRRWSVLLTDSVYFIHLLYGVGIVGRFLTLLLMLLSCIAVGFGVMLWLEKKAKIFDERIPFYHWMGKLSLTIMIGVVPATASLFVLQWALPFDLENRVLIQQVVFYNFWIATLAWSFYRINSYIAIKEFLFLGGILFISSSIIHFTVSDFSPIELFQKNMFSILGVDISLILLGCVLIFIAKLLPKSRDKAKFFWNKKYKRIP
jgi:uncharacterized iron-regulated membrane protein